jgi:polyisoprenoid-binding protein YceI
MSVTSTVVPTGTWTVDPAHSKVGFAVKHMGIATVRGVFGEFSGSLEVGDEIKASGSVQAASVDTNEAQRDEHLRSPDFFNAQEHAELTFTSTAIWGNERVGLEITGQLSRGDFGMTFNQALGSGNLLVADKVKLALDISAVKQA